MCLLASSAAASDFCLTRNKALLILGETGREQKLFFVLWKLLCRGLQKPTLTPCPHTCMYRYTCTHPQDSVWNSWGSWGFKPLNKWQVIFSWEWSVQTSEAINHFGDHPCRLQSSLASSRLMTTKQDCLTSVYERVKCLLRICGDGTLIDFR